LPIIFGLIFQAFYLIADTFFVIKVGHEAVAAITFSMPIFLIIIAISTGFGLGITTLISRYIGARDKEKASAIAHHAVIIGILLGFFISLIGYAITPFIFRIMGASGLTLNLSIQYFRIIFIGSFFLISSMFFRAILAGEGNYKVSTTILILGVIINLILNTIFIFVLNWGIQGVAWATFISFLFSFIAYFIFLFVKKYSYFDFYFHFEKFEIDFSLIQKIFKIGAPVTIAQVIWSTGIIFTNYFVSYFGQTTVAGYGLASRLETFYTMIVIGTSSGLLTLVSMYIGAKRNDLVNIILKYVAKINLIIGIAIGILFYFFSDLFLLIFTKDQTLIGVGIGYFKIVVFSYPLIALIYIIARLLQCLGNTKKEAIINLFRFVLFFLPLIFLFVRILNFKVEGIWYAYLISNILAFFIAMLMYKKARKRVEKICDLEI
jgi:putative MATE family efflux protein